MKKVLIVVDMLNDFCYPNGVLGNTRKEKMDKELFKPGADYNRAIRLALNADVEPKIIVEALWYDMYDEVFLVHVRNPDGTLTEEVLESGFVFSCFKAVQEGITKWVG